MESMGPMLNVLVVQVFYILVSIFNIHQRYTHVCKSDPISLVLLVASYLN